MIDLDLLHKLNERAAQRVQAAAERSRAQFERPEHERQMVLQYMRLKPEDHAAIARSMGDTEHAEYMKAMDALKARYADGLVHKSR